MKNPEYVQISVHNHQNFQPETLLSLPSMMSALGYAHTGSSGWDTTFEFCFDMDDPRSEPSDKQIIDWLGLRFFEVDVERYGLE